MDNGCSFIYLYTIIYQQFRTRCYTKYQVRRVLVNNADLQCPMAQSSLEGALEDNCFLPSGLHKLGLHDWLIEVCSECCTIPSFGVNGVICLRSTVYSKRPGCEHELPYFACFGTTKPDFSELKL